MERRLEEREEEGIRKEKTEMKKGRKEGGDRSGDKVKKDKREGEGRKSRSCGWKE